MAGAAHHQTAPATIVEPPRIGPRVTAAYVVNAYSMPHTRPTPAKDHTMTLEEFAELVRQHDLTYSYSDDNRVWRKGQDERIAIEQAARDFDPADVQRIWNEAVDKKLAESARAQFYWRMK
jgi:hypothetical protein